MSQPLRSHHSDVTAPHTAHMSHHDHQAVNSSQKPDELIKKVHENALDEYHRTKKDKQQELSSRVEEARRTGNKVMFKNAKKKVDNHASSVASRARRGFLIKSFENVVRHTMEENHHLAELLTQQQIAHKIALTDLRRTQHKLAKVMKEKESLKASASKNQASTKSPSVPTTDEVTWNQSNFAISMEARGTDASASANQQMVRYNEMDRNDMELGELDEDGSRYFPIVSSQIPAEVSLKMDGPDWGPVPAISLSVQAQIKADNHEDVFARAL